METGFLESLPYGGHFGQPILLLLLVWFWYSSLGMPGIQYWVTVTSWVYADKNLYFVLQYNRFNNFIIC